jgi:hypothetical protein
MASEGIMLCAGHCASVNCSLTSQEPPGLFGFKDTAPGIKLVAITETAKVGTRTLFNIVFPHIALSGGEP